jgi:N-acetylglucosaminyldiphosphoundecaprenol N-acetyl-beta-D-mannosaminyltransferase
MSQRSTVFGLEFSPMTRAEVVRKVVGECIEKGAGPRSIYTANLDHIVHLRRNQKFRSAYRRAWVVTADGTPVFLYAMLRGAVSPERVTGADLFGDILGLIAPLEHRCFFVASSPETASLLTDWLVAREFDRASIDYEVPPFGFEKDVAYSTDLARRIAAHGTTHLFLGVGAPKSEIWADEYWASLGDCYILSAGAGLDFFVGVKQRAPRIVQRVGLEWLWRFSHEPRRLFRRYFVDSLSFIAAVRDDIRDQRLMGALTSVDRSRSRNVLGLKRAKKV